MDKLIKVLLESKSTLDFDSLTNAKDLYGEGLIDSFDIIVIVDELNCAFNIDIDAADISRDDFLTVEAINSLVQRMGGN